MPFTTIDLCAGIGGIRKGFELTGEYVNILSAEIDKYACKMYEHLYGDNPYNDLTSDEFKKRVENINYDILLAGFPCQSFSRAGLQMGFCDQDKGIIFSHIADIISRTRPKAIFLENVDNLIRHDEGKTFKFIINIITPPIIELPINFTIPFNGQANIFPNIKIAIMHTTNVIKILLSKNSHLLFK